MTSRDEREALVKRLAAAAHTVLCESNGVDDNEWRTKDGVLVPAWPVASFKSALAELEAALAACSPEAFEFDAPAALTAQPSAAMCIFHDCDMQAKYCDGHAPEVADTAAHPSAGEPVAGSEAIGEMRESGVHWFKGNPHSFPVGTQFYAAPSESSPESVVVPKLMPQEFSDWLESQMPPRTIISDTKWWAPKIYRAAIRAAIRAPSPDAQKGES